MTIATIRFLESFEELGRKHAMRLKDGRELLGWVQEVGSLAIRFQPAPGPFCSDPAEIEIAIDQIDLGSLAYLDDGGKGWIDFLPPA
jgi:hypothetical protein